MKGVFGKGGGRDLVKLLHYQAGALVVMVTVFRLGWCAVRRAPKVPAAPGGVVGEYVGRMVHWGLYAALLAVPVAGLSRCWRRETDGSARHRSAGLDRRWQRRWPSATSITTRA